MTMKTKLFECCALALSVCSLVLTACSYYTPPATTTTTLTKHHDPEIWTPKTDDVQWQVESGWHEGKQYNTEQGLKPNKVEKKPLVEQVPNDK